MDAEGYLPITLIASFHRVQALSADVALVMAAVKSSDKLEVYKDFLIRTKNDPLKWPMPNVGADGVTVVPVVAVRPEIEHPQPTAFIPVILQAAPPPVSEVLHHIPPPPMIRNSRKNASDIKQPQHIAAVIPVAVAAAPPPILPNSSVIVVDHLNPDVSAFVPKTSPKNEVANAAKPPAAKEHIISEATDTAFAPTTTTEDANIWKEVKRRSKSSQQKEIIITQPSPLYGSDVEINNRDIIVNNNNNTNNANNNNNNVSTAVNSNSVSVSAKTISANSTENTKKSSSLEKEELDFRFDEEMQFDEEIPHSGGRINNFSELSDDDDYESDYELSDRDINKLLIVTQVKARPPKHEGTFSFKFSLIQKHKLRFIL